MSHHGPAVTKAAIIALRAAGGQKLFWNLADLPKFGRTGMASAMSQTKPRYWFPVKRYGRGSGVPQMESWRRSSPSSRSSLPAPCMFRPGRDLAYYLAYVGFSRRRGRARLLVEGRAGALVMRQRWWGLASAQGTSETWKFCFSEQNWAQQFVHDMF